MNVYLVAEGVVITFTFILSFTKMGATLRSAEMEDGIDFFNAVFPLGGHTANYDRLKAIYEDLDKHLQ